MVEFDRFNNSDKKSSPRLKVTVVGVGGGGLNVLDRISLDRVMEASLLAMDTDIRDLNHSMAQSKIQLGSDLILGIGSGGDPDLAAQAARLTADEIRGGLYGSDIVFISGGLGGGTCSGAAPVVAEIAKSLGAMVFVFASMPFSFQGRRTVLQAEEARVKLQNTADALILFENSRMGELILPKEGIQKAFSQADQLIGHSIRAISSIVNQRGLIGMNVADVMAALKNHDSRCLFGYGEARGQNRVQDVLKRALKSPLINEGDLLANAKNLLVHIAGGENFTLDEVQNLMTELSKKVPDSTRIMFGLSSDVKLGDSVCLTLLSSLSAQEVIPGAKSQVVPARTQVVESAPAAPAVAPRVEEAPVQLAPPPSSQAFEVAQETTLAPVQEIKEEIKEPVQAIEASLSQLIASHHAASNAVVTEPAPEVVTPQEESTEAEVPAATSANFEVQATATPEVLSVAAPVNPLSELTKVEAPSPTAPVQEAPASAPVTSSSLFRVVEEPLIQEGTSEREESPIVEAPVTRKVVNPDWLERYINSSQSSSPAAQASAAPAQPAAPQPTAAPQASAPEIPVQPAAPAQSSMFKVVSAANSAPTAEPRAEAKATKPEPAPSLQPAPSLASMFSVATSHLKEQTPNAANKHAAPSADSTGEENLDVPTWLRMREKSKG